MGNVLEVVQILTEQDVLDYIKRNPKDVVLDTDLSDDLNLPMTDVGDVLSALEQAGKIVETEANCWSVVSDT